MQVRAAAEEDVGAICGILEAAFLREDEARLFRNIRDTEALAVALVAVGGDEDGPTVAGVAVLSQLLSPENCLGLGPIAVAEEHRDLGAGGALISACIEWARDHGHGAIFVLGRPRFYTRFGFTVEAARPFVSPFPAEFLLALEIDKEALAGGGELRYPPAFAALS